MKTKITLLCMSLLLATTFCFAQKDTSKSIINNASIKKYHDHEELTQMNKGELIKLYMERIQALTNTIPYISFATKPGVTMSTLGIPNNNDNRKALDKQLENTDDYLKNTIAFQKKLLPYSDKNNIIAAIFFYEEIMKSLHTFDQFH